MSNSEDLVAVLLPDDDSCTVWTVHYMTKDEAETSLEKTINEGSSLNVSEKVLNANTEVIQELQVDTSGYLRNRETMNDFYKGSFWVIAFILALVVAVAVLCRIFAD